VAARQPAILLDGITCVANGQSARGLRSTSPTITTSTTRSGASNNNNDHSNNAEGGSTGRISPVDEDGSSKWKKNYHQLLQWPKLHFCLNRVP